jgi:kexin
MRISLPVRFFPRSLLLSLLLFLSPAVLSQSSSPSVRTHVVHQNHAQSHYYAMHVHPDTDPRSLAADLGLEYEGSLGELEDHHLFSLARTRHDTHDDPLSHKLYKRSLSTDQSIHPSILFLQKQTPSRRHEKRCPLNIRQDEIPPLVQEVAESLGITDPMFPIQWHLLNPIQLGHDLNVTGIWREGNFGENVTVAIVDDGLDMDSLDLKDNYFAAGSYDFNDHNLVPKPKLRDDQHGTRCAGEIAAVKNDVCGVGVAYRSKVAGIRILSGEISDADEAIALNYAMQVNHIYSCSWGPPDDGKSMDAPGMLIKRSFVNGINKGRGGLGSIFVFASGNGGAQEDNCNFDGYTNSIYSVTVGAVDRMGQHPYYSELCSAQLVVAYSSGSGDYIHTTDVGLEKCADRHGGTSAAAPLAAGIFALALSVRPDLTWRDLQQLCVDTAQMVDDNDPDWETVANGHKFNHKYGFGKLDAWKLVEEAKTFEHVKPQAWHHAPTVVVEEDIPDNAGNVTSYISVGEDDLRGSNLERVEHVQVRMNLTHARRGDVVIDLISPEGIVSHICTSRKYDTSNVGMVDWYFMSVKHWSPTRKWLFANVQGFLWTGELDNTSLGRTLGLHGEITFLATHPLGLFNRPRPRKTTPPPWLIRRPNSHNPPPPTDRQPPSRIRTPHRNHRPRPGRKRARHHPPIRFLAVVHRT